MPQPFWLNFFLSNASSSNTCSQSNKKKERPQCTHCHVLGHTVDLYYKLHGYLPSYNQKNNPTTTSKAESTDISSLTPEQCQGLLSMLQSHLAVVKTNTTLLSSSFSGGSHIVGTCSSLIPASNSWIIDSGASTHICYSKELFPSLTPVSGHTVTLLIKIVFKWNSFGVVHISPILTLNNVLFVPQFQFNLISVSALVAKLPVLVSFNGDTCLI